MKARAIDYRIVSCGLGRLLVAATRHGVCHVRFGDSDSELLAGLRAEFPRTPLGADSARLAPWSDALLRLLDGRSPQRELPLDVRGSPFQRRVWDALRRIPRGATCSYAALAASLGLPGGARAVARACATNPVPLAIPCHRVLGADGTLRGYRYGIARKRALLLREAARPEARGE